MSFEARQVAIKQRNTTDNGAGGETVTYGNTSPAQTAVACYRSYRSPAGVTQYSEAGPGVIQEIEAIYFFDLPLRDLGVKHVNFIISHGRLASTTSHAFHLM